MANTPNFANREVADLIMLDYATKAVELFVDWANVTSTAFEAERVFATGGQGAPNRVTFDGGRTGTLTIEAQVYPAKVYKMLSGNEMKNTANMLKRVKLTAGEAGLTLAEAPADENVQVFAAADDYGTEIECALADKVISGDGITAGNEYIVYYFAALADAQVIHFDGKHFPKALEVFGSVPYKNEKDEIVEGRMHWFKVSPQGGFELSWSNTGDPVTLTLTLDVLADADNNIFDMAFVNEG